MLFILLTMNGVQEDGIKKAQWAYRSIYDGRIQTEEHDIGARCSSVARVIVIL
jgi:hypothetical protein